MSYNKRSRSFGTIQVTILIAIAVIALSAVGSFFYVQSFKGEIKQLTEDKGKLTTEVENQKVTIGGLETEKEKLKGEIKDFKLLQKVDELNKEDKQKAKAAEKIIDDSIAAINKKYDALPKTDVNAQAKMREQARERMRGAWLVYCIDHASNARCKDPAVVGSAAAASAASK